MDRIRRIAEAILEKYPDLFTDEFEKNKQLLVTVATIRSKTLRNETVGYITSAIRERGGKDEDEGQTLEEAVAQPAEG